MGRFRPGGSRDWGCSCLHKGASLPGEASLRCHTRTESSVLRAGHLTSSRVSQEGCCSANRARYTGVPFFGEGRFCTVTPALGPLCQEPPEPASCDSARINRSGLKLSGSRFRQLLSHHVPSRTAFLPPPLEAINDGCCFLPFSFRLQGPVLGFSRALAFSF